LNVDNPDDALMLQFLEWLSFRPRTYADVMGAWRSSCPKHTTFEDALADGLIEVGGADEHSQVTMTERGRTTLDGNGHLPR